MQLPLSNNATNGLAVAPAPFVVVAQIIDVTHNHHRAFSSVVRAMVL